MPADDEALWGKKQAYDLLHQSSTWLQYERDSGRWHTTLTHKLGGLATVADFRDIREVAAALLASAPDEAFSAGVISNLSSLSRLVLRELAPTEQLDREFPLYQDDSVLDSVRRLEDSHIQSALAGMAFAPPKTLGDDDLAREEYVSTVAVAGEIQTALRLLDDNFIGCERHLVPLMVACVESFRRGDTDLAQRVLRQILEGNCSCWQWLHIATGFLRRIPWDGYPYPDY